MQNPEGGKDADCQLCEGAHVPEPVLENLTGDSLQKTTSPSLRNTCHESNRPLCVASWNESSDVDTMFIPEKEFIGKEPAHQTRIPGWLEENMKGEDTIKKALWESEKEKVSLSEQLSVKSLVSPHEKPFVEMGESLLDCIIKESPIKDVSYFLTQPHGSLFKIYPSFGTEELFSGEDNLNLAGKAPSPKGNMDVTSSVLSDLPQKNLKSGKDCLSTFNVQRVSQMLSKVCNILALADGHIMCQDTDHLSVIEHNRKNEAIVQLQEEVKNLTLKKKTLEKKIEKLKNHLELKEEECKRLTGENDKLHEDLRSMTLKVVSYEKIIACPDERLGSSQIPQFKRFKIK
ncbi:cancer-associated gene 1 protein [Apteryx mantelli]|uniref:Cancer-associated gene 1 protein n=1 Tax=Apteryx mantelli TaxID=2696672 RepID=A0ABM4E2J0_9AVES